MEESGQKDARIERIRSIVQDDFNRIQEASSPYQVLNVSSSEAVDEIEERYQRYERFYRAENFQRLGDIDLTRKALDIRRAIGRAIVDVRKRGPRSESESSSSLHDASLFAHDDDRHALSQIYLRDGLTYLQLGDLNEAGSFLSLAVEYGPQCALGMAYLGYVTHKRRSFDQDAVKEARRLLDRAVELSPEETDIHVLRGRFFAKQRNTEMLSTTIEEIERIDPAHPTLDRLQRKLHKLRD